METSRKPGRLTALFDGKQAAVPEPISSAPAAPAQPRPPPEPLPYAGLVLRPRGTPSSRAANGDSPRHAGSPQSPSPTSPGQHRPREPRWDATAESTLSSQAEEEASTTADEAPASDRSARAAATAAAQNASASDSSARATAVTAGAAAQAAAAAAAAFASALADMPTPWSILVSDPASGGGAQTPAATPRPMRHAAATSPKARGSPSYLQAPLPCLVESGERRRAPPQPPSDSDPTPPRPEPPRAPAKSAEPASASPAPLPARAEKGETARQPDAAETAVGSAAPRARAPPAGSNAAALAVAEGSAARRTSSPAEARSDARECESHRWGSSQPPLPEAPPADRGGGQPQAETSGRGSAPRAGGGGGAEARVVSGTQALPRNAAAAAAEGEPSGAAKQSETPAAGGARALERPLGGSAAEQAGLRAAEAAAAAAAAAGAAAFAEVLANALAGKTLPAEFELEDGDVGQVGHSASLVSTARGWRNWSPPPAEDVHASAAPQRSSERAPAASPGPAQPPVAPRRPAEGGEAPATERASEPQRLPGCSRPLPSPQQAASTSASAPSSAAPVPATAGLALAGSPLAALALDLQRALRAQSPDPSQVEALFEQKIREVGMSMLLREWQDMRSAVRAGGNAVKRQPEVAAEAEAGVPTTAVGEGSTLQAIAAWLPFSFAGAAETPPAAEPHYKPASPARALPSAPTAWAAACGVSRQLVASDGRRNGRGGDQGDDFQGEMWAAVAGVNDLLSGAFDIQETSGILSEMLEAMQFSRELPGASSFGPLAASGRGWVLVGGSREATLRLSQRDRRLCTSAASL